MRIDVKIDGRNLATRTLREDKRLVYATTEAINKAGVAAQEAIRAEMAKDFTLRSNSKGGKSWLLQRIKFKFASVKKGLIYAEIYVDKKPRLLLAGYEKGDMREPFVGKNVAVPNPEEARQGGSVQGSVKKELTFRALGLKPKTVTPQKMKDTVQFMGRERTFLLKSTTKNPLGGLYQRVGPGKDDIRLVYSFKRAFHLKKMLGLVKTATRVFEDKFPVEFSIAMARRGMTR